MSILNDVVDEAKKVEASAKSHFAALVGAFKEVGVDFSKYISEFDLVAHAVAFAVVKRVEELEAKVEAFVKKEV